MRKPQATRSAERDNTETELKLVVPPGAETRFSRHAAFSSKGAAPTKSQRLVTTYFDTPSRQLERSGLSLRVRSDGRGWVQTLKSTRDGDDAISRGEWEWPVTDGAPSLGLIDETPAADRLPSNLDCPLEPVVVTDVKRISRTIDFEGSTIEAALDRGSIVAGGRQQPIHELELELRDGSPSALYRLALSLHESTPLSFEIESKASRGYRLRDQSAPSAANASEVMLPDHISALDGLRLIVANAVNHLLSNKLPARSGDPEGIHQARVAIRRLRTALRLFAPKLEKHAIDEFQSELQRLGRTFGAARDWDVFCLEVLPDAFDDGDELGRMLREAADRKRRAAERACALAIDSASFTSLALGLSAWMESGRDRRDVLGGKSLERPLSEIAPPLLDRIVEKANERGRSVRPEALAQELHPLRKSLKKVRYSVEFLSSLYPGKPVRRFVSPLKDLQKTLGEINDAATAVRLADRLVQERIGLAAAMSTLARMQERSSRDARKKLEDEWDAYRGQERFWR